MAVHTYLLAPQSLALTHLTAQTLDAMSLKLPDGVYTTMRTYERDHILGLSAHLQRLIDSHSALKGPRSFDLPAIRVALHKIVIEENQPALRLRITTPFESDDVYISVEPFKSFPAEYYVHGVRCATSHLVRAAPAAKHTSFIKPSRSEKAGADPEIHEILMVNEAGEILEGFSSNFYGVRDGNVYTAGEGVLEGVTRKVVLAEAKALVPIILKPIQVSNLPRVTEAFITSSGREVMPVRQIDDAILGEPGPVTRKLMALYKMRIRQDAELP